MTKTYSSIHQIEILKEHNPWTKKVMDMVDGIRITGGPITGDRLNKLHEIANKWAQATNELVLEELNDRLSTLRDKLRQIEEVYNQNQFRRAIEVTKNRTIQKYGKKINWIQLKESVSLVSNNLNVTLDETFKREIRDKFKEQPTIQKAKKPPNTQRANKGDSSKIDNSEIQNLRKELAILTDVFTELRSKIVGEQQEMEQGKTTNVHRNVFKTMLKIIETKQKWFLTYARAPKLTALK
ncbi:unnamed protein product [Dimorphilus gyrociliatus]|uniref:Uncharacterized protein n=1 Tax=Dimorphilus gyrociliatus TaxID=2664684 RepID=A0A7I8WE96_9ANNE|nr:unnamed protein product [Dimorphilus gyrociliatus]